MSIKSMKTSITTAAMLLMASVVFAAVPTTINYQGYLTDSSGAPLTGTVSIVFSLYTSGGAKQWTETQGSVSVAKGRFSVQLGSSSAFTADLFDTPLYLGVKVGSDAEMTPRKPLSTAPYAFYAETVEGYAVTYDTDSSGKIDAGKIDSGVAATLIGGGTVDNTEYNYLDGVSSNIQAQFTTMQTQVNSNTPKYKTAYVYTGAPDSNGEYALPTTAMANVATWCGTPSSTNMCLVKILPGVYTVSGVVTMQSYVDIEGSGEGATKVTGSFGGASTGVIKGASNAELRLLTVEQTGGDNAIYNTGASPAITHVTATASGGTYNYGVYNNQSSSPVMTNVTATASGGTISTGVLNQSSSSPVMTNVTATASGGSSGNYAIYESSSGSTMNNVTATASGTSSYGLFFWAGSAVTTRIYNSTFKGTTGSINKYTSNGTIYVANSQLDGAVTDAGGTFTCWDTYGATFAAATCP